MTLKLDGYREMNATPFSISFTIMELVSLVDQSINGIPPGNGWGVFNYVVCDVCKYAWVMVAMLNTLGKECPHCGHFDPKFMWTELAEFKGEGSFLTPIGTGYSIVTKN